MIAIFSPSKTLDLETEYPVPKTTQPVFLDEAETLMNRLQEFSPSQLAELMSLSDNLTERTMDYHHNWQTPFTEENARPALATYTGAAFAEIGVEDFSEEDFAFAQKSVRIISGLYGTLRPLDLMQAYRLEMKTKLQVNGADNLYDFWGEAITQQLNEDLAAQEADTVVNLASNEYRKAISPKKLNANFLTVSFKEESKGKFRAIGVYAKQARGQMIRYIVKNRLTDPESLKDFTESGYQYNSERSKVGEWVFTRPKP